jgi:hypothetical protein
MKKTEKIITAAATIAFGVLLMILQGSIVSILMTVLGVGLIAFGVMDLINKNFPHAVVKLVCGLVVIICGWVIVSAVLYILAAVLLIAGILLIYEKIRCSKKGETLLKTLLEYAMPILCIVIGVLLMFNQGNTVNWVFIIGGIFTVVEGGLLLVGAFTDD